MKFSSDRSTFHRGLHCLFILFTLLYPTKEMFKEPDLFPVRSSGTAGGPVLENISFCRNQLSGYFPTFSHADGNGFSLVNLVFFLELETISEI